MFTKKIFSLLGLLFIGNRIDSVFSADAECNVFDPTNCISNVYYLVNKQDHSLINDTGVSGSLYYCSGGETKICEEQTSVGYYFVDPKTVYVCRINNSPFQCTKESIPDERNACTEDNIGKLFVKTGDSTASLCLNYAADTPSVVELNGSAKGNYLVYKNSNPIENVFGITGSNEKYAIVGIQDKVVSLNSTYSNGLKYVYVDATKNRVMEKGDKDFPKLTGSTSDPDENNIMELLCNNGGICKDAEREQTFSSFTGFTGAGIYILKNNAGTITKVDNANIADGDLALNIHIYKCDAQINCEKISGYAWNTGRTAIYRIPASGVPSKLTIEDGTITSCNENIGLIYTSSGDNYICMEDGYAAKIENNKYYIFGEGTMYTTHNPFPSVANKIFKMTADYGIIDENYNAENGKNYVVQTGTGVNDYAVYKYYESSDSFIRDSELSGVKNYDLHDTGLNIYDEYPLKDTKSIAEADIANWALFNCKHGECLQTYGYMKSQNEDKYFKYYADGTTDNAMLTTTGFSQCSSDGENGLMSNGKLCITHGNESTRVTGDMSNGNLFVVHSADGDPFYNSAPDDLLLEATSNSITISNIYEGRSGILTHKNQKILSSSITEGTEGNNEKLILYDCEKTGSCERLGGYAINGSKIYSVLKTDSSSKSSIKYNNGVITEVSACSSASSGTIVKIGTENYLCLDNTNKVKLTDYGYYALGNDAFDSGSPFVAGDKKKMIKITEDLIAFDHIYDEFSKCVIKNSDKYTVYSQSSKLYTKASEDSGVFVYNQKNNDNVFVNVVNPASVTNLPDIEKWSLFDCALGNCQRSFGYYKPGTNYFSIAESGINEIFTPSAIEDNHCLLATDAGNLLKDGKLCVVPSSDYDQQKNATMAFGRYLISTDNNSIFTAAHQGESIVVEGKETSFIWKSVSDINIYSVDSGTIGIPDYTTSDDTRAKIGLYKCSSNICKKIDGYAYSDSKYYTIDKSSGASLTSISEGTCDQAASIGKIITKEGVKTLCLGSGASVPIPDRKGRFVVGTVDSGSKLTNNKLINITGSYIVVDDVLEQESTIHFLIKFDSVYIAYKMNTNSKTFSIDNTVSGMKTYQKIDASDDTNVYREITSMSDISYENVSELDLFQCSGGQCKEIPGYVLVSGNEVFKCTGGSCGNAHGGDKVASCTGSDVGKTIIKAAQGNNPANIQLCTGASASIDITNTQAYYIGNNPIKYVGNVEKTVIGLPIPDMGYFLINNNVLVTTPSNDDKLIQCDGTSATCTVITSPNNSCTTANVGKFTSEKKLCLADGKSTAKAIGNTGSYLISSGDSSAFASEVKSPKFGVISMTANSITLDSSKSYICVSNEDLTVTDRTSSSASCSSGKPYSCSKGVCKEGSSAPSSSSIALSSCPDTCASTEAATSLCIDSDGKIHDVDSSGACKSDVLDIGTHVIEINENEVAKKVTLGSKSIDLANAKRLLMFECDADKKCTTVSGYAKICTKHTTQPNDYSEKYGSRYFNDEACSGHASGNTWGTETYEIIYYSITSTGSSVTNTIDRCTTENVGKLLSDGSLCIKDGDAQALGDANYVIYSYNGSEVINASDNLFVRKSITGLVNGVNVIDVSKAVPFALSNLATTALADDVASVRLYECDTSAKICNPTYGYIKSKETDKTESYFTIPYTGANAKVTAETGCSSKIGFIYKDTSNNQKLCLSATDNESAVVGSTKKIYQIKQTITAGNPFIATGSVDIVIEIGSNYMAMKTMPAGLHLYKIDTSTHEITDINYTGSDTIADADKTKLHFYNCNVSKCIETYGYVKVGSDYYKIAESGSDKIADGQNTCTEKNLGVIDTTGNNLCLGGTNTPIPFNTNNNEEAYHFMGNLNGNIFTGVGTDESTKKILIKSVKNALILDNLDLMDTKTYILKLGEEYKEYTCDGTKFTSAQDLATTVAEKIVEGVWLNVINDPSTATDKTKLALFNCASGTCTPNVGYVKSGSDYYAVHGSGAVLLDTESFVTCTSPADMGSMTSDGKVCLTANEDPAQALTVNGNGSYILSVATEHTGPLADVAGKNIILTASGSGAVFIYDNSIDSGPRVINTTTMKDQSLGGTLNAETDVPNIALFNCEKNGICKRTTGYVKDNGSAYYYIGESGSDNTDDSESTKFVGGCSESDNGKVDKNNDYKICGTDLAAFPDSDGQYLIYDGSSNYLFIRTIANAFTIVSIAATNIQETDVYGINASNGALINLGTATDDVLQANIEEMTLYYCEATDHTCTRTYGYFKANDKYFEVTAVADGKNGEVTVAAQCSGNVGKLLTGNNKLCIDATDDHAKAFSTGDIDYYFMTVTSPNIFSGSNGGAILVKSIANAFIIHTFGVVDGEDYIIKDGNDFKIHEYSSTTFSFTLQNDASEDTGIRVVQKVTDNASVIIDPSGTGNLADLALFNCASGVCTQTVGYVKDKDDKFYKVSASTTTELQAEDYVTCSTDGTPVGGLVSGGTLCLDGTSEIASSGIDDYLLDVPAGNDSVFSASAGKKIIVNVAANTITFTNNYSDGTKFCIVDDTLKKTTYDTGANCKSSSSGTPYECDADGYCVEESLD